MITVSALRHVEPVNDRAIADIWRDVGLPEYFLGNAGTNHRLVEFANRLREQQGSFW